MDDLEFKLNLPSNELATISMREENRPRLVKYALGEGPLRVPQEADNLLSVGDLPGDDDILDCLNLDSILDIPISRTPSKRHSKVFEQRSEAVIDAEEYEDSIQLSVLEELLSL